MEEVGHLKSLSSIYLPDAGVVDIRLVQLECDESPLLGSGFGW